MDRAELADWVRRYEVAWRTSGIERLAELFAPDATYRMDPYGEVTRGLDEIGDLWERERDGPDEVFELDSDVVAVEGSVGVLRVDVRYGDPVTQEYRELWIVRFGENGLCVQFEEWPHWPPGTNGGASPSARQRT